MMDNRQPVNPQLKKMIEDYLLWMMSEGYASCTITRYEQILNYFKTFILGSERKWNDVFTYDTFVTFQKESGLSLASRVVKGCAAYLFKQGIIPYPIKKPVWLLPEIFEEYLDYYVRVKDTSRLQILRVRRSLKAFSDYLDKNNIMLKSVRVEQIDAFLAEHNRNYTKKTRGTNRSILRDEIRCLFESLTGTTQKELRTAAMVHLGFSLGLRPKEISLISLDDIGFKKKEICISDRKNTNPARLPLPESTIKAVAAYILGARPKTDSRRLFITVRVPYKPVLSVTVSEDIAGVMKKAGLPSTAYWLRHTYAQNLLEADVSFFEIKEMMGHDSIQTTRCYLYVHTKLMREVLFGNEESF
jgi:site-specific recombinase XerD